MHFQKASQDIPQLPNIDTKLVLKAWFNLSRYRCELQVNSLYVCLQGDPVSHSVLSLVEELPTQPGCENARESGMYLDFYTDNLTTSIL